MGYFMVLVFEIEHFCNMFEGFCVLMFGSVQDNGRCSELHVLAAHWHTLSFSFSPTGKALPAEVQCLLHNDHASVPKARIWKVSHWFQ